MAHSVNTENYSYLFGVKMGLDQDVAKVDQLGPTTSVADGGGGNLPVGDRSKSQEQLSLEKDVLPTSALYTTAPTEVTFRSASDNPINTASFSTTTESHTFVRNDVSAILYSNGSPNPVAAIEPLEGDRVELRVMPDSLFRVEGYDANGRLLFALSPGQTRIIPINPGSSDTDLVLRHK